MEEDINGDLPSEITDELVVLLEDKDSLISKIETSRENVDSKIGDRETDINKALGEDWKNTYQKIIEE